MQGQSAAESFIDLLCGASKTVAKLIVLSNSMAPLLISGDEVILLPCSWKQCSVGSIIVFRQGVTLAAHRYIHLIKAAGKPMVLQKGDAMEQGGLIPPDAIIGTCISRVRNGVETSLTNKNENKKKLRMERFKLLCFAGREVLAWVVKKLRGSRLPLVL